MSVVLEVTNMPVRGDDSEISGGTPLQSTTFGAGTVLTPSSGAQVNQELTVSLVRSLVSGSLPETFFDSTKLYKLTIEEV
jgi:hypothetical protein